MNLYEFIYNMTVHISFMAILFLLLLFIALYFTFDFIVSQWHTLIKSREDPNNLKVDSYNKTKDTS